jgi:hypothetical protein
VDSKPDIGTTFRIELATASQARLETATFAAETT